MTSPATLVESRSSATAGRATYLAIRSSLSRSVALAAPSTCHQNPESLAPRPDLELWSAPSIALGAFEDARFEDHLRGGERKAKASKSTQVPRPKKKINFAVQNKICKIRF
jgi:hypothetical protein